MTPLNLTLGPPRPPRAELDGLIFLPRTIDKVRASLPGGDLGAYTLAGLSHEMLAMLGIEFDAFTAAVAAASDDAAIAAFLREHARQDRRDAWNAYVLTREPRAGNRAAALVAYPWLAERPDLTLALDVLAHDDALLFGLQR